MLSEILTHSQYHIVAYRPIGEGSLANCLKIVEVPYTQTGLNQKLELCLIYYQNNGILLKYVVKHLGVALWVTECCIFVVIIIQKVFAIHVEGLFIKLMLQTLNFIMHLNKS